MTREQLKSMVAEDYLKETFELLIKATTTDARLHNALITQFGTFNSHSWASRIGTLYRPEEVVEKNKVVENLLNTIDKVPVSWLQNLVIPVAVQHIFEVEKPNVPIKPKTVQWLLIGLLTVVLGIGSWMFLNRDKKDKTETPATTSPSVSTTDVKPVTGTTVIENPPPSKPKEVVPKSNPPIKPPTVETEKPKSQSNAFIGVWKNISSTSTHFQKLEFSIDGEKTKVHIIGYKNAECGTLNTVSKAKKHLYIKEFDYQTTNVYQNVNFKIDENGLLKMSYYAERYKEDITDVFSKQ